MIVSFGYMDGSGEYFITVDNGKCVNCSSKPCISACPKQILEVINNDYDESVMAVKNEARNRLKEECSVCKPNTGIVTLPCISACPYDAIKHSW